MALEDHYLWKWNYRCIVRLAIRAQQQLFSCWHPYLQTKASRFDVDGQRLNPVASQQQQWSRKIGSQLFMRKLNAGLKEQFNASWKLIFVAYMMTYENKIFTLLFLGRRSWDRPPSSRPLLQFRSRLLIRVRITNIRDRLFTSRQWLE